MGLRIRTHPHLPDNENQGILVRNCF